MTKPFLVLIILCLSFLGHTQDHSSKLVALLHQQDIDFRLELIQQVQSIIESSEKIKDSTTIAKSLYSGIASVYKKQFTSKELKELYDFYSSPLGIKLIEQQGQLQSEISTVAYKWEMELQGISVDSLQLSIFDDKDDAELIDPNVETVGVEVVEKVEEKPLPNIATLEDLKALLRKDPFIITDQNILMALFGKEDLDSVFEQLMKEEGVEQIETKEKEETIRYKK